MSETVAIIGLGLLGGSLARDLSARGFRVLGMDRDPASLAAALDCRALHAALSPDLSELPLADVLVLAVPVTESRAVLERIRTRLRPDTLVTDVASTKLSTETAALDAGLGAQFVGAHPLAGDHRGGWAASRTGLFDAATVYLCPAPGVPATFIDRARAFWEKLGGHPVLTTAADHDALLAHTSHLPQAIAFLLARVLARAGIARDQLGPGGRDTLRLAASPPELWSGIVSDNASSILPALAGLRSAIHGLEDALRSRNHAEVRELFESGRHWFEGDKSGPDTAAGTPKVTLPGSAP